MQFFLCVFAINCCFLLDQKKTQLSSKCCTICSLCLCWCFQTNSFLLQYIHVTNTHTCNSFSSRQPGISPFVFSPRATRGIFCRRLSSVKMKVQNRRSGQGGAVSSPAADPRSGSGLNPSRISEWHQQRRRPQWRQAAVNRHDSSTISHVGHQRHLEEPELRPWGGAGPPAVRPGRDHHWRLPAASGWVRAGAHACHTPSQLLAVSLATVGTGRTRLNGCVPMRTARKPNYYETNLLVGTTTFQKNFSNTH